MHLKFNCKFRSGVDSVLVAGNSLLKGWWILGPPVIQHKDRNLTKYWDLTENRYSQLG